MQATSLPADVPPTRSTLPRRGPIRHRPRRGLAAAAVALTGLIAGAGSMGVAAASPAGPSPATASAGSSGPATSSPTRATGPVDDVPFGQGAAVAHDPASPTSPDGTGGSAPANGSANTDGTASANASGTFTPDARSGTHTLPPTWPEGVDVASWQHPGNAGIDWRAVARSGVRFAIVKATEGTGYTNPYFTADRHAAWNAGLAVGAYHYARPAWPPSTAVAQANYFLARTGDTRGTKQLAPVLDLEVTGGLSGAQLSVWVGAFLRTVETATGRAPILYTYRSFWTGIMGNTTAFARYPLWFAIYNGQDWPGRIPGGWPGWMMWQFTSSARVPGIRGAVDQNVFCCSFRYYPSAINGRPSELGKAYASSASLRALLGPLRSGEAPAFGGGRWALYRLGMLYWSIDSGALEVHGGIATKYLALGGPGSLLGHPLTNEFSAGVPGGRESMFAVGRIYWSHVTGAHEVHGGILARYLSLGAAASALGLPLSDEFAVTGGRESAFQHGYLRWDAITKAVTVIATAG